MSKAYFRTVPLLGPPVLTAPRMCHLCGAGFTNWKALRRHCDHEHRGMTEYRKRLFWEAQKCDALGLPSQRKRTMVANASAAMVHSGPGDEGEFEERKEEACVVCARKWWLSARFRCYLWKPFPGDDAGEL